MTEETINEIYFYSPRQLNSHRAFNVFGRDTTTGKNADLFSCFYEPHEAHVARGAAFQRITANEAFDIHAHGGLIGVASYDIRCSSPLD